MTNQELLDNLIDIINKREEAIEKGKPVVYLNQKNIKAIKYLKARLTPLKINGATSDFDDTMIYLSLCPHCGADINSNQEFCPECMQNLDWSEYVSDTIDWR